MNDAFTVTLIILIAALLRRSLLPGPGVSYDTRSGRKGFGFKALVPATIEADRPHPARWRGTKR